MKILELQLLAFGPFTNLCLDFAAGEQGLHVLFGPNEAGKSSALRALKALLYGIPHITSDNFQHDNQKLRIGGRLGHSDGMELSFIRRKGQKNTLLGSDERPLPDASLSAFLAGVSAELFSTMFGIDHAALRRGGEELLQGGGEVGQSLFSAALGGINLRQVQQDLDNEARQLFLPAGQNPKINKSLAELRAVKRTVVEESLAGGAWAQHKQALEDAMAEQRTVLQELARLSKEQHRLARLQTAIPRIAKRKELFQELQELVDVVLLPPEFAEQRRGAMQRLEQAKEADKDSRHALERLSTERQAVVVPQVFLEHGETIMALHERLGSHRKAAQDRAHLEMERRQLEADAQLFMAKLPPTLTVAQVKERRLQAAHRARVQELARQYQARVERLDRATKDVQKYDEQLNKTMESLNALAAPKDPSDLRQAVSQARQQGNLDQAREQVWTTLQSEEEQAQIELTQLSLWSGTLDELEHVPIPAKETVDQFESTFRALDTDAHHLTQAIQKAHTEIAEFDRQLEELRLAGAVPGEEDLARAREQRDRLWRRVRHVWLDEEETPQGTDTHGTGRALAEAYQYSVDRADEVADRLRREAERVTRQATWLAQRDKTTKALGQLAATKDTLDAELRQHRGQWHGLWQSAGITPLSPREMRPWLNRYEKLLQRAERIREARRQLKRLDERIHAHGIALHHALEHLGAPSAATDETLSTLLVRSEAFLEAFDNAVRHRLDLQKHCTSVERELEGARREQREAVDLLDRWQTDWTVAVAGLGLDGKALPVEASAILEVLDDLLKTLDDAAGLAHRIEAIDRDAVVFAEDVRHLASLIAPDLVGAEADQAAAQLHTRYGKAQADAARRAELDKQIKAQETALREAQATIEQMSQRLLTLCRQAGCSHPDELPTAEARSAQRQQLQKAIDTMDEQLLDQGAGATLTQLIQEAEAVDADALPAQLGEIAQQLEVLETKRSRSDQAIGREQTILAQMDGGTRAAEAAETTQGILTEIRGGVDRYVRLRLASMLLRREIERYRISHQAPLLSRASTLFSRLTLGSFARLETDYNDKDQPVLVGVRAEGGYVGVEGMSDGTRDQLYLALRLATLEQYLANHEPLPFVVDDILIQFDDQRAGAALQVLAELSAKTQVLFFTHHWRLVELAKSIAGPHVVQTQQLRV
ncbi:MAG TPA: AAA family ATPase [Candidatus Tectomicrobia bacterium]|nr:AAA family ATPase [Candidatus Tectomicrobia bacterium]